MVRLKVKRGSHRVGPVFDENGAVITQGKNYSRGEIFETEKDLSKLFPEKFLNMDEYQDDATPRGPTLGGASDDELEAELKRRKEAQQNQEASGDKVNPDLLKELEEMTVEDLKTYAGELQVQIPSNATKAKIIELIAAKM